MALTNVSLAADIGGTFTDIVAELDGVRQTAKTLTTPSQPEEAVLSGVASVLEAMGVEYNRIGHFVHGATLATNAIIERKGARTALIATDGFRDIIEIADESRYHQYDINIEKPVPLIPRCLRFTVPERIDVSGAVQVPLDETALRDIAGRLVECGIESVAVCFLHSYVNPDHEKRARDVLADAAPGIAVSLSNEVCPEIREYERTSTTVANAFIQPIVEGYISRLQEQLAARGCTAKMRLMSSGGHLTSLETARRFPVRLVESGPAGGAIMAADVALERAENRVLSFDMGGTTAKICFVEDGAPLTSRTFEVDRAARFLKGSGLPIRIPVIEMIEIGAGGGSIAGLDATKSITVGPKSAGSEPGPACYARGGSDPTVTDADVILGRIAPEYFADGAIELEPERSATALAKTIGAPLDIVLPMAALGVSEVVEENMANAARVHAAERGVALKGHTLVAFGGAAPLHAARLAEKLGLERIIIPADAGVGSAVGFLRAPIAYELIRSLYMRLDAFEAQPVTALLESMSREARPLAQGASGGLHEQRAVFMRYCGQGHEIAVALPDGPLGTGVEDALREAFETEYREQFERHIPGAAIEALNWSVTVNVPKENPQRLPTVNAGDKPPAEPVHQRDVFDATRRKIMGVPVYIRGDIAAGAIVSGPALIVERATTTYVTEGFEASVDAGGALVLTLRKLAA
ncbi:MAG: hydantoinase/oxoprolinase family protein [Pseudomonadota bacterium]